RERCELILLRRRRHGYQSVNTFCRWILLGKVSAVTRSRNDNEIWITDCGKIVTTATDLFQYVLQQTRASQCAETEIDHVSAVVCVGITIRIGSIRQCFGEHPRITDASLIEHSHGNDLRVRRNQCDESGDVCSMTEWSNSLVTDFAWIVVEVDEVKSGQEMAGQCRMRKIDAGVEHRDLYWLSILADAAINLLSVS